MDFKLYKYYFIYGGLIILWLLGSFFFMQQTVKENSKIDSKILENEQLILKNHLTIITNQKSILKNQHDFNILYHTMIQNEEIILKNQKEMLKNR